MMKICIKIFGVNFSNSILDKSKWVKISEGLAKNPYLEQTEALFERGNCKPNPLIQTVVHRPILYDSIIYQKGIYNFLWNRKKIRPTSQTPSSALQFNERTRYFRYGDTNKFSKNKMDSKVIESQQCSLETSHAVSVELNSEL